MIKIRRTIPPSAAPIPGKYLWHGLRGFYQGEKYLYKVEEEIKRYFGAKYVFMVSSGKAALYLILRALKDLHPGKDEVLIPAYTCFSVPSAILKAGLKVSLCDIDPLTLDFNYELLRKEINPATLCILSTHLFGRPADLKRLMDICLEMQLFAVEDAAQAMGGCYGGKKLGTIGDVGFFSLGRGKNITCGSGGIIVTNSDLIAKKLQNEYLNLPGPSAGETIKEFLQVIIMSLFIRPSLYWLPAGMSFLKLGETNFLNDFPVQKLAGAKAGLLEGWRTLLENSNLSRERNSSHFIHELQLPQPGESPIPFLRFPYLLTGKGLNEVNRLNSKEKEKVLGISRMYPTPINEILEIHGSFKGLKFPVAKKVAECLLTLPTHQLLMEEDRRRILLHLSAKIAQRDHYFPPDEVKARVVANS